MIMSLMDKLRTNRFLRTAIASGSLAYLVSCGSGSSSSNSNDGNNACVSEWSCSEYGECQPDGRQYRTCSDLNSCNPANNTKTTSQNCTYDPCKDGECTVTVEHDGLVALAFYYQDRNNNGIDDIDEWAENASPGCSVSSSGGCIYGTPEIWKGAIQQEMERNGTYKMDFEGINNRFLIYHTDGRIDQTKDIPDSNMDNLISIAELY